MRKLLFDVNFWCYEPANVNNTAGRLLTRYTYIHVSVCPSDVFCIVLFVCLSIVNIQISIYHKWYKLHTVKAPFNVNFWYEPANVNYPVWPPVNACPCDRPTSSALFSFVVQLLVFKYIAFINDNTNCMLLKKSLFNANLMLWTGVSPWIFEWGGCESSAAWPKLTPDLDHLIFESGGCHFVTFSLRGTLPTPVVTNRQMWTISAGRPSCIMVGHLALEVGTLKFHSWGHNRRAVQALASCEQRNRRWQNLPTYAGSLSLNISRRWNCISHFLGTNIAEWAARQSRGIAKMQTSIRPSQVAFTVPLE